MTSSWGTQTYAYDDIYQVTGVDYPAGYPFADKTYNYDPVGNRDSTVNGGTVDYQNNELNEYTTVGWTAFTSDLRGNLTSDGTHAYQYDLENRLSAVDGNITYAYNPFGLRNSKTVNGSITQYILDDQREIEEWEGGELVRKFIYGVGIDEPLVMETGGGRYYYHFDALGSVQNLTDLTGSTVATYRYDIYGASNLIGSSHGNLYTFTGSRYDPESELIYFRLRYYSPKIGRFVQTYPAKYTTTPSYINNLTILQYYMLFDEGYSRAVGSAVCESDGSVRIWVDSNLHCCTKPCVEAHENSHKEDLENSGICERYKECIENVKPGDIAAIKACQDTWQAEYAVIEQDSEDDADCAGVEECENMKNTCSKSCDCREGTEGYDAIVDYINQH